MQLNGRNSAREGNDITRVFGFLVVRLNVRMEPSISYLSTNVTPSHGSLGWSRLAVRLTLGSLMKAGVPVTRGTSWGGSAHLGNYVVRAIYLRKQSSRGCLTCWRTILPVPRGWYQGQSHVY